LAPFNGTKQVEKGGEEVYNTEKTEDTENTEGVNI